MPRLSPSEILDQFFTFPSFANEKALRELITTLTADLAQVTEDRDALRRQVKAAPHASSCNKICLCSGIPHEIEARCCDCWKSTTEGTPHD